MANDVNTLMQWTENKETMISMIRVVIMALKEFSNNYSS